MEIDNRILLEGVKEFLWSGESFPICSRSMPRLLGGRLKPDQAPPAVFIAKLALFLRTEIRHANSYSVDRQIIPLSELIAPLEELAFIFAKVADTKPYESFSEHELRQLSHIPDYMDRAIGVLREEARHHHASAKEGGHDGNNKYHEMMRDVMIYKGAYERILKEVRARNPEAGPEEDHGLAI
jgi:hypothetical protein